jgi:hypothetical protein
MKTASFIKQDKEFERMSIIDEDDGYKSETSSLNESLTKHGKIHFHRYSFFVYIIYIFLVSIIINYLIFIFQMKTL